MTDLPISLADVRTAAEVIVGRVHRTPIFTSRTLSELCGGNVFLKAENLQKIGAFKARGATNALSKLSADELRRGVIGISAGNHGIALSWAAKAMGTSATVVMPEGAAASKVAAIEGYGGRAVLVDGTRLMENMESIVASDGQTFIHPFDNPFVMAGQGTVGLEIMEHMAGVDVIIVPVGGGGLISGVAVAAKALNPQIVVLGVEPAGSTAVSQSLAAGRPVKLESFATVADGLNAPFGAPNTFAVISRLVDDVITVPDGEIIAALLLILERTKLLVEPAGAAAVAGLLSGQFESRVRGKRVVAVLSGGNVDRSRLAGFLAA